ncbi:4-hydroxyphenylacetate 3-monooxygenase, oxygenase component [Paenibacillus sambharensis]|uniref:4-hydroxyphenylacetate 3-monooxygenase, oxygenase component n=1 Tax=Paenibacillus sambharensis TaxID=1803190 RepID=A0A2W1LB79_9BACL|nr:4-hydroxyphenylacetate 3-monooxygenase, oxygenase component [Paenibacillus sambharensis]PZD95380.1 4-hydroxyphenylacetate 3-monooxygenase, oxygenase component [Paenibacillus sambharensis]
MPIKNGADYIRRINGLRPNIQINGAPVNGPVAEHPAFKGVVRTQAALYDYQCHPDNCERMTFRSPAGGESVGISFLTPRTKDDLIRRRSMVQEWASIHHGFMGRSPDYMNTVIMVMNAAADRLGESNPLFAENIRRYYTYCMERDITLTHTFIRPQTNRASSSTDSAEFGDLARIVRWTEDGIVVSGGTIVATQGGITDEILVFPGPCPKHSSPDRNPYAFAFAIPADTKGLSFLCRESYTKNGMSAADYPLTAQFEEPDAIVVMEDVLVPWERVFLAGDTSLANSFFYESNFYTHLGHQVVARQIVKTEFFLGTIQLLIDTLNIGEYLHIQDKLSEVIVSLEVMNALLTAAEERAELDEWGTMMPDQTAIHTAMTYFPRVYPRFAEIIQLIGASGLVMTPTETDFAGPPHNHLNAYLGTELHTGMERVKLFRLAWDMSMSSFGARQVLYERFFFGDPARAGKRLSAEYDRLYAISAVNRFLERIPGQGSP